MNRVAWMFVIFLAPICCCLGAALQEDSPDFIVQAPDVAGRAQDFIILTPLPTPTPPGGGASEGTAGEFTTAGGNAGGDDEENEDENGAGNNDGAAPGGGATPAAPGTGQPTLIPVASPTTNASPTVGAMTPTPAATATPNPPPTATAVPPTQPPPTSPPDDGGNDDDDDGNDNDDPPTLPTATPLPPTATPLPPVVSFETSLFTAAEAGGGVVVTVLLDKPVAQVVTVGYATADDTALAGQDYSAVSGSLTFQPGQTARSFSVPIVDDPDGGEWPDEILTLNLTNPVGATLGNALATIAIVDDDNFVVNTTTDSDDGTCTLSHCSLREAINISNSTGGRNGILFDIPGSGPHTITPGNPLPAIVDPVIIDGYSQPGASANTLPVGSDAVLQIEIAGSNMTSVVQVDGLRLAADSSLLRGLVINSFPGSGIFLTGSNNRIEGCYIGPDVSGEFDRGNGVDGIIFGSPATANTIGGATPAQRNVISGNDRNGLTFDQTSGNFVFGNYIGLNRFGTAGLGNSGAGIGIFQGNSNQIGGVNPGQGNVMSANGTNGLELNGAATTNTLIQANLIGTGATGTVDLGNGQSGIFSFNGAANNIVGSNGPETTNLIAYNSNGVTTVGGTLTISYTTIRHNDSWAEGGGLYNEAGTVTLAHSTISHNRATSQGGGLFNRGGSVSLVNSTVSGNEAIIDGHTLVNTGGGTLSARYTTFDSVIADTLIFTAATSVGVGQAPHAVTAADFDGDGRLDLAVANDTSDDVSLVLGDGSGGFSLATTVPVGNGPEELVAADFDGDGRLDLAVANTFSNDVTILLGDGSGGFGAATPVGAGAGPWAITAADFDGDGRLDLAVVNDLSDEVSILAGDGSGGFSLVTTVPVGDQPHAVVAEDFDGDGFLDLAVANAGSDDVSLLTGDGSGFSLTATLPAGGGPEDLVAADFDGDGFLDLATANLGSDDVTLLVGDGAGGFNPAPPVPVGSGPGALVAADLDGDGRLDLAVANDTSNDVSLLLGDGSGGFSLTATLPVGNTPWDLVAADFDGDGFLDLATANDSSDDVSILLNQGKGRGVVNAGGTLTLQNSLVDSCRLTAGTITSNGYNLTADPGCTPFLTASTDLTGLDPLLGPLQDNGGPTETHALRLGSPARDAIPLGVNGCGTTITTDQRDLTRPQSSGCDIGAFEVHASP